MTSKKKATGKVKKPEWALVHAFGSHSDATVVEIINGCMCGVHAGPISERAAQWLLEDLQNEVAVMMATVTGDIGELYQRASNILAILDYSRPAKSNALSIAIGEARTAGKITDMAQDIELPF